MDMHVTAISSDALRVVLTGHLDMAGSAKIDIPFNAAAGSNRNIVVDMSAVTFLASIGIRMLLLGAKTVQRRGGKLVLLSPQSEVEQVLEMTCVTDLMPIVRDEAEALAAISACAVAMVRLMLSHSRMEMGRFSAWLDQQERLLVIPASIAHAVRLCLEEAVANIIDHTPRSSDEPEIAVELDWQGHTLVAVVEDRGPAFADRVKSVPQRIPARRKMR